jgi:NTE family protein
LGVLATDISKGEKVILTEGKVSPAVMASTCIPGVFEPIYHKDKLLVDGGIIENVPVSVSRQMGADFIIAVDLTTTHMETQPKNILGVLLSAYYIIFRYQT